MSGDTPFVNELSRQEGQETEVLRKVKGGFRGHKQRILKELDDPATYDRSKKGGVDAPIIDLVQFLNTEQSPFVTSSSCSGRVAIFAGAPPSGCESFISPSGSTFVASAPPAESRASTAKERNVTERVTKSMTESVTENVTPGDIDKSRKEEIDVHVGQGEDITASEVWLKGGEWLYVTHDPLGERESTEVYAALDRIESDVSLRNAMTTFKFEPFIVHVQCLSLSHARTLLNCGLNAGFRNSGMVLGAKKLSVAIRSTMHLDVPIGLGGKLLVSREYVDMLIAMSNEKFLENVKRIERLYSAVRQLYCTDE